MLQLRKILLKSPDRTNKYFNIIKLFFLGIAVCVCMDNANAQCRRDRKCREGSMCVKLDSLRQGEKALTTKSDTSCSGLVLVTWNIGHFSNGQKKKSTIAKKDYNGKLAEYRRFIYDLVSPDVICLNEMSPELGEDPRGMKHLAADVLFDGFNSRVIGEQRGYNCNAVFGKTELSNVRTNEFECSSLMTKEVTTASNHYYLSADLYIGGEEVTIVCLHLAPRAPRLREMQMEELIDKFKDTERVIMCGDWNASKIDAMDAFIKAGYVVANDGSIPTYSRTKTPLDNIVVKGLEVSDVRTIETNLSDHYPLICRISLK